MNKTIQKFILAMVILQSCQAAKELKKTQLELKNAQSEISTTKTNLENVHNELQNAQSQLNSVNTDKNKLQNELSKFGEVAIQTSTSADEEEKALAIVKTSNWIKEQNRLIYKNDLITGLGKIWILTDDGYSEGRSINLKEFDAEAKIKDNGSIIFQYFIDKNFQSNIDAIKSVTANVGNNSYARLTYEILGTSELNMLQDNIQKVAQKYAYKYNTNKDVKRVFLCTGYFIEHIGYVKYNKINVGASANTPVISVNGEFYSEDKSVINSYEVWRQLTPLSFYFVPTNKDSAVSPEIFSALPANKTVYQYLKDLTAAKLTDEDIRTIIDTPNILIGNSARELAAKREIELTDELMKKLESIAIYLQAIKAQPPPNDNN